MRTAALVVGLLVGFVAGVAPAFARDNTPSGCCKVCRDSKPCGNGCIKYTDSCDKPPGCAC